MPQEQIVVRGAREHNLKGVSVSFPRDRLVVAGDANHNGSSDSATFEMSKADSVTAVTRPAGPYLYAGLGEHAALGQRDPAPPV